MTVLKVFKKESVLPITNIIKPINAYIPNPQREKEEIIFISKSYNINPFDEFSHKVENVQWFITEIGKHIIEIESYQIQLLSIKTQEKLNEVSEKLMGLMNYTNQLNVKTKDNLQGLIDLIKKKKFDVNEILVKQRQIQELKNKFVMTIRLYQKIEKEIESRYHEGLMVLIQTVKPTLEPAKIESVMQSPELLALSSYQFENKDQFFIKFYFYKKQINKIESTTQDLNKFISDIDKTESNLNDLDIEIGKSIAKEKYHNTKLALFTLVIVMIIVACLLVWWYTFPNFHPSLLKS